MNWKPKPAPFSKFKKENLKKSILVTNFIYQLGEYPQLRQPSKEVSIRDIRSKAMQKKVAYLKKCLIDYRRKTGYGRGIAAVQVGIPERFAVIYCEEKQVVIINPQITKASKKKYKYSEMCMSASPIIAPVVRPAWIEFLYSDENGEEKVWDTKDDTQNGKMINRVFQHEIDHLDGIINIDLVSSPKELILFSDPTFYDSAIFEEV